MPVSIVCGAVSCGIPKKDPLRGFKVIQGHRLCHQSKELYNFIIVVNSNLGCKRSLFGQIT